MKFLFLLPILAIVLVSGCTSTATVTGDSGTQGPVEAGTQESASGTNGITLEELSGHSIPEDCWIALHGKVYDVSGFGETHGGGEAVYEGCGIDATELYETRPMGSGTPHSETARAFLPNFFIGELAE